MYMPIIEMNLELRELKHRLFFENWNAGIASRILGIIIAIILLIALPAAAEDMPEWNEDFEYLYGMQIYDADGEYIYDALLDMNILHVSGFVTSITLPIINDVYPNTTIDLKHSNYELPQMVVKKHCDESCQINFFESITDEHIVFPKFIQEISSDECKFDIIATGTHNLMQMLVIVDGAPYIDDDLELECFSLDEGNGYEYTVDLKNMAEGEHQIFALALPIYNIPEFIPTAPKIVFYLAD